MTLIEFECRHHRFALPLAAVRRVIPSALPTPLPGTPPIVLGLLNLGDEVATIINFYEKIGLPFTPIDISQQMLLLDIAGLCIGLVVDKVSGVITRVVDQAMPLPEKFAGADFVQTVIRQDDGLCIICNPEKFLLDEERILIGNALEQAGHARH